MDHHELGRLEERWCTGRNVRVALLFTITLTAPLSCDRIEPDRDYMHSVQSAKSNVTPATQASAARSDVPTALPGSPDVAAIVARVRPAVVNITVTSESKVSALPPDPFEFFFGGHGPFGGSPRGDTLVPRQALGSGFIIDADGHVVTNAHVVANAKTVKVRLLDDREFKATVRGRDPQLDVAVLELEGGKGLPTVPFGSSDALPVGAYVVAIGNPFGLGDTVTMGIVSAKSRALGAGPYDDFIQTDAAINPGNSGGPLLNVAGEVIGINTAINPSGQGIGFAIPIDSVKHVLDQLLATGHVSRGRLGVVIQHMDEGTAKALGLDRAHGALVADVEPNGPAAKAGIASGDVIVSVDGKEIRDSQELPRVIAGHLPGTKVDIKVLRGGRELSTKAELAAMKEAEPDDRQSARGGGSQGNGNGVATPSLGVGLADTPDGATVVQVKPGSPADGQLQPGDVIREVNREKVKSATDVAHRIQSASKSVPLLLKVHRGDNDLFIGIERG
jgi:serine protease Do